MRAGISRLMIFSKMVMTQRSAGPWQIGESAQRTIETAQRSGGDQFLAHETDHLFPQGITGAGPDFCALQMFDRGLERTKMQGVGAGVDERLNPFLEQVEEGQLVPGARFGSQIEKGN